MSLSPSQQVKASYVREREFNSEERKFGFALQWREDLRWSAEVEPTDALITLCSLYGLDIVGEGSNVFRLTRQGKNLISVYPLTTMKFVLEYCVEAHRKNRW